MCGCTTRGTKPNCQRISILFIALPLSLVFQVRYLDCASCHGSCFNSSACGASSSARHIPLDWNIYAAVHMPSKPQNLVFFSRRPSSVHAILTWELGIKMRPMDTEQIPSWPRIRLEKPCGFALLLHIGAPTWRRLWGGLLIRTLRAVARSERITILMQPSYSIWIQFLISDM